MNLGIMKPSKQHQAFTFRRSKGTAVHRRKEWTLDSCAGAGGSSQASAPGMVLVAVRVIHSVSTPQADVVTIRQGMKQNSVLRHVKSVNWKIKYLLSMSSVQSSVRSSRGKWLRTGRRLSSFDIRPPSRSVPPHVTGGPVLQQERGESSPLHI